MNQKNQEVLLAHIQLIEKEPRKHNFGILKDLAQATEESKKSEPVNLNDEDQRLFFGNEFSDRGPSEKKDKSKSLEDDSGKNVENASSIAKLIDYEKDFDDFMSTSNLMLPSQLLMDDSLFNNTTPESNFDLLDSLVPSQADATQSSDDLLSAGKDNSIHLNKNPSRKANASDVSKWFSLFSELDPLNQQTEQDDANKNLHAA